MRFVLASCGASILSLTALTAHADPDAADGRDAEPAAKSELRVGDVTLTPALELRTRGAYRRDPPDLGGAQSTTLAGPRVRDAVTLAARTRVGLAADTDALSAVVTLQDARALGNAPASTWSPASSFGTFGVYEAYGALHGEKRDRSFIRLGRQAIQWGEGRLLGKADFSPTGRSFDALRLKASVGSRFEAEALGAALTPSRPLGTAFGDRWGASRLGNGLFGARAAFVGARLLRFELYTLGRVTSGSAGAFALSPFETARADGELGTFALRIFGGDGPFDYGVEGALQKGRASAFSGQRRRVEAWASTAHVAYRVDQLLGAPTFRLLGSYASGDNGRGRYKQFDPLYADVQTHHTQMDLFAWSNLLEAGGDVTVEASDVTRVRVGYRALAQARTQGEWIGSYLTPVAPQQPATGLPLATAQSGRGLGHALEARIAAQPLDGLTLSAGYSLLVLGRGARAAMAGAGRAALGGDGMLHAPHLSHYALAQATVRLP